MQGGKPILFLCLYCSCCEIWCWQHHVVGKFFSKGTGKLVRVDGLMGEAKYRVILEPNQLQAEKTWRLAWRLRFKQENKSEHSARAKCSCWMFSKNIRAKLFLFYSAQKKYFFCNFVVLKFRDAFNQTRSILERRLRKIMGENKGSTILWMLFVEFILFYHFLFLHLAAVLRMGTECPSVGKFRCKS